MASNTRPERGEPKRRSRSTCLIGCLVVLVIIVLALLQGGKGLVERLAAAELAKAAPADSWRVDLPHLDFARLLLGRPFGITATARGLRPKDAPRIAEARAVGEGMTLDRSTRKVRGPFRAEVLLEAEQLGAWVAAIPEVREAVHGLRIEFVAGQAQVSGRVELSQLVRGLPNLGLLQLEAHGKPVILGPTELGLDLQSIELDVAGTLSDLGLPTQIAPPAELRQLLRDNLRLKLDQVLPDLTLQSVAIEPRGLRITGRGSLK